MNRSEAEFSFFVAVVDTAQCLVSNFVLLFGVLVKEQ